MECHNLTLQCTLEADVLSSTQYMFHHPQEAALISQQVSSLALRSKPAEWLAVKTGELAAAARRRASGSVTSQQTDEATLVRCHSAYPALTLTVPCRALPLALQCAPLPWPRLQAPPHARRVRRSKDTRSALQAAGRLLPEVIAHDDFVGRTGTLGGWHPQVGPAACSDVVTKRSLISTASCKPELSAWQRFRQTAAQLASSNGWTASNVQHA